MATTTVSNVPFVGEHSTSSVTGGDASSSGMRYRHVSAGGNEVIVWKCPSAIQHEDVRRVIALNIQVNQLIEAQKKGGCFSTSYYLQSRTSRVLVGLKVMKNLICGSTPCFAQSEKMKAAFAARLLCQQAAWVYKHKPAAVAALKPEHPWKETPYADAKDMFAKARADLFANKNGLAPVQCSITTCDGIALDGIYFPGTQKKVILLAIGLTAMYEECAVDFVYDKFISFFKKECEGLSVLIVNTRGINLSEGTTSPVSLQVDIFSAYQFLIQKQGFDPEDVLVYGHSLGGCYGLQGAALIQKEYPSKRISAVVDRSFVSFAKLIEARSGKIIGRVVQSNGLEMNSQRACETLKGRVVSIVSKGDETVPYKASFPVQLNRSRINLKVIEIGADPKMTNHHIRKFSDDEAKAVAHEIKEILG